MRYRALSPTGDFQYGRSGLFLIDSPAAVAQAISTRLKLVAGEWFLDNQEGTPYNDRVLGTHTQNTRDLVFRQRILDTPGVKELLNYYSVLSTQRVLTVTATVSTIYGVVDVTATL